MSYKFSPTRPTSLKERIYLHLCTIPEAKEFLNWCCYSKIISKDSGLIDFTPNTWYDAQFVFVDTIFTNLEKGIDWYVFLKARQLGITTVASQFDLFYNFKHSNLQSSIVSADYRISDEVRSQIRIIYEHLPIQARQPKKQDNSLFMSFRNNSRIKFFFTTGRQSKKGNMGRSGASNYCHGTEVAYFQNLEDWNAFVRTLSHDYPFRLYIWESTANQYNHWYDLWETAGDSNTQKRIFLGWWLKETYREDDPKELLKYGYTPVQWEQENIDLIKKLYDYDLSIEQLAW